MRRMLGWRAAFLAAAVVTGVASGGCSLVSLDGLSGGHEPSDGSAGGGDVEAGTPAGYAAVVLGDGPLAYWRLDETSGTTAADSSGHGNDATYEGGFMLGLPGAVAGDGDTAVSLDGVSGLITAGNRFEFAGQTPFSLEAWVMARSQSTYAGVATCNDALGGPPSEGYLLFISPAAGPLGFQRLDGSNVSTAVSAAGPAVQEFTYVVATFDGLELTVYANGEPQGTQTAAFSIAGAGTAFVLGAEAGGMGNYLAGALDEVAVYDHALSADRVRAHYLAGIASP